MCREDRRRLRAEQTVVELRRREPLEVQDVCAHPAEARQADQVLRRLDGEADARAVEDPGADRVEQLPSRVPLRRGSRTEPEA